MHWCPPGILHTLLASTAQLEQGVHPCQAPLQGVMLCQQPVILILQTLHTFGVSVPQAHQKRVHFISVRNAAVHD